MRKALKTSSQKVKLDSNDFKNMFNNDKKDKKNLNKNSDFLQAESNYQMEVSVVPAELVKNLNGLGSKADAVYPFF